MKQMWTQLGRKKQILLAVLVLLELFCMLAVWPGGVLRRERECHSGTVGEYTYTDRVEPGQVYRQGFVAQESVLKKHAFSLDVEGEISDDWMMLYEFLDESGRVLLQRTITAEELRMTGYREVDLDLRLKKGREYAYALSLQSGEGKVRITCTPLPEDYAEGLTELSVDGKVLEGQSYDSFLYMEKLNIKNVIFTWIFLWIMGVGLWSLLDRKGNSSH